MVYLCTSLKGGGARLTKGSIGPEQHILLLESLPGVTRLLDKHSVLAGPGAQRDICSVQQIHGGDVRSDGRCKICIQAQWVMSNCLGWSLIDSEREDSALTCSMFCLSVCSGNNLDLFWCRTART